MQYCGLANVYLTKSEQQGHIGLLNVHPILRRPAMEGINRIVPGR